ncbi:MAG TPA: glycosyltransferase family 4 protein [Solirubrobacterales bacterium]|jgi:phosphatidylinositol alpha-mannosyltransferase
MRIALVHPTYWPEVRRGSERVIHDLGVALAERGHDVTVLTTHDGPSSLAIEDGMRVLRARRPPQPPGLAAYEYHLTSAPAAYWRLRRGAFDVAHCFFPTDAWAALRARERGGPPVVATNHGVPTREYLVARRYRLDMQLRIAREADECTVLSEAAARPYRRYLLRDPVILPGGVLAAEFESDAERAAAPTFFCASALGDPRKRAGLLFAAFERVRAVRPDARLVVARSRDPFMSAEPPALPEAAKWIDVEGPGALARAYASAWATVNAAPGEAFGLVLVESLAAGTPVVGDSSGATPEILGGEPVGATFAPDDEADLARAMLAALELAERPETRAACKARAQEYDWARLAERYEAVYERVVARAR